MLGTLVRMMGHSKLLLQLVQYFSESGIQFWYGTWFHVHLYPPCVSFPTLSPLPSAPLQLAFRVLLCGFKWCRDWWFRLSRNETDKANYSWVDKKGQETEINEPVLSRSRSVKREMDILSVFRHCWMGHVDSWCTAYKIARKGVGSGQLCEFSYCPALTEN